MARKTTEPGAPVVAAGRAIELLRRQLKQFERVSALGREDPAVRKWTSTTAAILEGAFGQGHEKAREFRRHYGSFVMGAAEAEREREHREGMQRRRAMLESGIEQLQLLAPEPEAGGPGDGAAGSDALGTVMRICERFDEVAEQLTFRRPNRTTIYIDDEYDVQDLLHALLRLHFDDVRTEEWTPSYAGHPARMDFLLKPEQIVIEVKMTRMSLSAKELTEELLLDTARYRGHPDCKRLVCFVYDKRRMLHNPRGIERDLGRMSTGELEVVCVIAP